MAASGLGCSYQRDMKTVWPLWLRPCHRSQRQPLRQFPHDPTNSPSQLTSVSVGRKADVTTMLPHLVGPHSFHAAGTQMAA